MKVELYIVINDYEPKQTDEIMLRKGDLVIVLDKQLEYNDGWWEGQNHLNQIGLFPSNFVLPYNKNENKIDDVPKNSSVIDNENNSLKKFDIESFLGYSDFSTKSFNSLFSKFDLNFNQLPDTNSQSNRQSLRLPKEDNNTIPSKSNNRKSMFIQTNNNIEEEEFKTATLEQIKNFDSEKLGKYLQLTHGIEDMLLKILIKNEIDGEIFINLNTNNLKEMGISSFAKRYKLCSIVERLKENKELNTRHSALNNAYKKESQVNSKVNSNHLSLDSKILFTKQTNHISASSGFNSNLELDYAESSVMDYPKNESYNNVDVAMSNGSNEANTTINDSLVLSPLPSNNHISNNKHSYQTTSSYASHTPNTHSVEERLSSINIRESTHTLDKSLSINLESSTNESTGSVKMEGWLKKRETFKMIKHRYCVLNGNTMLIYRSDKREDLQRDPKSRISLTGYKPTIKETTFGKTKYVMKISHQNNQNSHYFLSSDLGKLQKWTKEIIKVNIEREYNGKNFNKAPVISSCIIDTIPLSVAQMKYTQNDHPKTIKNTAVENQNNKC